MLFLVALALLASGEIKPSVLAKGTRQLSTAELNAKLAGTEVELVVPPEMRWLHPGEYFTKDGNYTLYGHQEKSTGSYRVRDNAVCTKVAGEPENCRFILVDVDGLFWIGTNTIYADQFRQIRFKAVKDRESVRSGIAPQVAKRRILAGSELRQALSGKYLELSFPPEMKMFVYPEQFNPDGTYVRYGDNSEREGTYSIRGDRFCTIAKPYKPRCRHLYVGSNGRFWVSDIRTPNNTQSVTLEVIR